MRPAPLFLNEVATMSSSKIVLALAAFTAIVLSGVASQASAQDKTFLFLDPAQLPPDLTLPAPPADGTPRALAELAEVKAIMAASSPERIAQATADSKDESVAFFGDVVPGFDLTRLPVTRKLFDEVRNDEDLQAKLFKTRFARTRPYNVDTSITTCDPSDNTTKATSYPSGHATMAYSMAIVLANLVPAQGAAIQSRAQLYAENRLVCGVHYRADIVAGQVLGTAIGEELLHAPKFQADLDAARAELVAAGVVK